MYGMKYPIGTKETLTHGSNYQSSFGLLLLCSNAFVLEKLFQKNHININQRKRCGLIIYNSLFPRENNLDTEIPDRRLYGIIRPYSISRIIAIFYPHK